MQIFALSHLVCGILFLAVAGVMAVRLIDDYRKYHRHSRAEETCVIDVAQETNAERLRPVPSPQAAH